MSLELPALVYKNGGSQQRANGTYSYLLVSTQEELTRAIANGWHETFLAAIGEVSESVSDAAPTRAEMEIKAAQLGLKFHPAIGDFNLLKKIEDAVKAQG